MGCSDSKIKDEEITQLNLEIDRLRTLQHDWEMMIYEKDAELAQTSTAMRELIRAREERDRKLRDKNSELKQLEDLLRVDRTRIFQALRQTALIKRRSSQLQAIALLWREIGATATSTQLPSSTTSPSPVPLLPPFERFSLVDREAIITTYSASAAAAVPLSVLYCAPQERGEAMARDFAAVSLLIVANSQNASSASSCVSHLPSSPSSSASSQVNNRRPSFVSVHFPDASIRGLPTPSAAPNVATSASSPERYERSEGLTSVLLLPLTAVGGGVASASNSMSPRGGGGGGGGGVVRTPRRATGSSSTGAVSSTSPSPNRKLASAATPPSAPNDEGMQMATTTAKLAADEDVAKADFGASRFNKCLIDVTINIRDDVVVSAPSHFCCEDESSFSHFAIGFSEVFTSQIKATLERKTSAAPHQQNSVSSSSLVMATSNAPFGGSPDNDGLVSSSGTAVDRQASTNSDDTPLEDERFPFSLFQNGGFGDGDGSKKDGCSFDHSLLLVGKIGRQTPANTNGPANDTTAAVTVHSLALWCGGHKVSEFILTHHRSDGENENSTPTPLASSPNASSQPSSSPSSLRLAVMLDLWPARYHPPAPPPPTNLPQRALTPRVGGGGSGGGGGRRASVTTANTNTNNTVASSASSPLARAASFQSLRPFERDRLYATNTAVAAGEAANKANNVVKSRATSGAKWEEVAIPDALVHRVLSQTRSQGKDDPKTSDGVASSSRAAPVPSLSLFLNKKKDRAPSSAAVVSFQGLYDEQSSNSVDAVNSNNNAAHPPNCEIVPRLSARLPLGHHKSYFCGEQDPRRNTMGIASIFIDSSDGTVTSSPTSSASNSVSTPTAESAEVSKSSKAKNDITANSMTIPAPFPRWERLGEGFGLVPTLKKKKRGGEGEKEGRGEKERTSKHSKPANSSEKEGNEFSPIAYSPTILLQGGGGSSKVIAIAVNRIVFDEDIEAMLLPT